MSKFDELLKLEEPLKKDKFGEWIVDSKHKGTKNDPIQLPFPAYTDTVNKLIKAVYNFNEKNPDYNLYNYNEVLEQNGYKELMFDKIDVSNMDDKCLMALFMALVRGERFCDGLIMKMLEAGIVQKWLKRLKEF